MGPLTRFLRRYASRYTGVYLAGCAFLLATNYINVLIPEYVQHTIDALGAAMPRPGWMPYVWAVLGLALAVIVTRTLSRVLFFNPGRTVEFRLKNDYYRHLLDMGPPFFRKFRAGELISRGTNDMMAVRSVIGFASLQLINVTVALALTLYKMVAIDVQITLLCLLPLLLGVAILRRGVQVLLRQYRAAQEQLASLSDTILDSYTGTSVITAFNAQEAFARRFDADNDRFTETFRRMSLVRSFVLPAVAVVGSLCLVLLLLVGGQRVIAGALTLGEVAAYAAYIHIVVGSLNSVGWTINAIQRGLVSLERVYEILDTPAEPEPATPAPAAAPGAPAIETSDLSWTYPEADDAARRAPALSGVSLRVEPGETLGIFGPTGSGKTTLVNLLARVLRPPPGRVRHGGRDVLDMTREELRSLVAVVPQDAYLFSRTIRENIGFVDLPAKIDDQRLWNAVRLAALEDEVRSFPRGLETVVGERGVTLSGGQRQRVALARAFYRDFQVLLLDDVLSAVDHTTERRLIDSIRSRSEQCTTVLVSHRISALVDADQIVVLEGGRVTDRGTHAELAARPGIYADTWDYQQQHEDEPERAEPARVARGIRG